MGEPRKGRQTPTKSVVLPYTETNGQEAIDLDMIIRIPGYVMQKRQIPNGICLFW